MMISAFLLTSALFTPVGPSDIVSSNEVIITKPSFEHTLTKKHALLDKLELEDNSVWEIASPDSYIFAGWSIGDTVVLTPHTSHFSIFKFDYSLTNITQGKSYVRVNLVSHPCDFQKSCRWVISIDHYSSKLFLNDGSSWKIQPEDAEQFKQWDINDFIVYGNNNEYYWSCGSFLPISSFLNSVHQYWSCFPFLLINTRLNQSVRAIQF